jgi:transposase
MMRPDDELDVYVYRQVVDFRKSINGLSAIVEQELSVSPFSTHLFVFCNRRRDKVKILYWERSGFVLWYKRLEKDRFPWPRRDKDGVVQMTGRELNWLLDGIDMFRVKPHQELSYASVG